jgi:Spy/CpxP family protein refolding chaperone
MNTLRRFVTALAGIVTTLMVTAAAATAKIAPPEQGRGGDGTGTTSTGSAGFPLTTALVALGICLAVLGIAVLVRHVRSTRRGSPGRPVHA